jgi:pimeloyl-ACP methyl ester carboxylesterase
VPVARDGGVRLRWHEEGEGEPLLLIMGLSGSARAWHRLLPHVAARRRTIVFDNRGTGDSSAVGGPLSMADMAADARAVLDAAGVASADVMGVSMGGMIAQHLALDHRDRVRSLILGCTTAGGARGAPPWRLLAASALRPVVGPTRTWGLIAPALFSSRTRRERPDRVAEELQVRVADATDPRTTFAQMAAIARHDTRARLAELAGLPVTVLHGDEDALVPVARGRELAAAIPGAEFVMLAGCGHLLTTDDEDATASAVLAHLARAGASSRSAA